MYRWCINLSWRKSVKHESKQDVSRTHVMARMEESYFRWQIVPYGPNLYVICNVIAMSCVLIIIIIKHL